MHIRDALRQLWELLGSWQKHCHSVTCYLLQGLSPKLCSSFPDCCCLLAVSQLHIRSKSFLILLTLPCFLQGSALPNGYGHVTSKMMRIFLKLSCSPSTLEHDTHDLLMPHGSQPFFHTSLYLIHALPPAWRSVLSMNCAFDGEPAPTIGYWSNISPLNDHWLFRQCFCSVFSSQFSIYIFIWVVIAFAVRIIQFYSCPGVGKSLLDQVLYIQFCIP